MCANVACHAKSLALLLELALNCRGVDSVLRALELGGEEEIVRLLVFDHALQVRQQKLVQSDSADLGIVLAFLASLNALQLVDGLRE